VSADASSQSDLAAQHSPAAVAARLAAGPRFSWLRDFVYGAVDGIVTTFAVVAGVAGAGLRPAIAAVLGCANLFADGFSMATANYLGGRAESQRRRRTGRRSSATSNWSPKANARSSASSSPPTASRGPASSRPSRRSLASPTVGSTSWSNGSTASRAIVRTRSAVPL
jgi:hypothetical protein